VSASSSSPPLASRGVGAAFCQSRDDGTPGVEIALDKVKRLADPMRRATEHQRRQTGRDRSGASPR
jgi:hypothetical protein